MVAKQDDSGNGHSDKNYISSESKKRDITTAHASQTAPPTNTNDQKQIIPVPSYSLDSTENYNSPQHNLKEHSWDDRVITSSDSSMASKEYHPYSTGEVRTEQEVVNKPKFDGEKSNIDSLFFAEQSRDKVIMPVPGNTLEGRKAGDWDEKIIIPTSAHGSGNTGTHLRAEQHREIKQGMQKLIMPVHYSRANDEESAEMDTVVQAKSETLATDKSKDSTDVKKEVFKNLQKTSVIQFLYNKKYSAAEKPANYETQDLDSSVKNFEDEASLLSDEKSKSKGTAQVIQGVLKDSGAAQKVSPSDRKQLFGDPRMMVLTSSEIEQQTENVKKYMNEQQHEEMPPNVEVTSEAIIPGKESSAPVSGPLQSDKETREQKIANDTKQQRLTDKEGKQQPIGLKSLKKGAESVKKIVSSLPTTKSKDSTGAEKEAFSKSVEQPINLKENIQKTSESEFLNRKQEKGKAYAKITNRKADNLAENDKRGETSLTGKSSIQEDTSVKYVVSEGQRDNEIQRKVLENNIKRNENNHGEPKSKIYDIKRIYRDEPSFEKEKQGRMTDDNVSAIEKYLQQEISKVSPEKARGDMTEPKKDRDSPSGEYSKTNAKTEMDLKSVPVKHFVEHKVEKWKKIHQNKDDNMQPNTKSNTIDISTKPQEMKKAKDAILKPIKQGLIRDQQKKPYQERSPPKETKGSPPKETRGPPPEETKMSSPKETKGSPPKERKESPPKATKTSHPKERNEFPPKETKGFPPKETKGFPPKETKGSPPKETNSSEASKPDKYSAEKNDPDMHSSYDKHSTGKNNPDMHSSYDKYSAGKNEPGRQSSFDKYSAGENEPDTHTSYDKNSTGKSEPDKQSSFDKYFTRKNQPDMHSSFDMHLTSDKYSTGKNEPNIDSSYDKNSTGKNDLNMNSSFDKYSTAQNEWTEEIHHGKQNTYSQDEHGKITQPQRPDQTNLKDMVSHYSVTDTKDTKLGNHKFQNINQQTESSNQPSKPVSQTQAANLPLESATRQGITSQSITLLDSPPRYMLKDIKESEVTKPSGGELHPGMTQNGPWPVHQLSTVNEKYLGKATRASYWGDAGTVLPWVSYVAQKKNNQNNLVTERSGHNSNHVNGYGSGNSFWQFLGRQYDVFKDNFNNHTIRGRANVAKATLLAVGLFTMWQLLKPKQCQLTYQRCSECGSITPMEKKQ